MLSGRGLCDEPITHPEESYWVWCVWVWSWILDNKEAFAQWGLLCHDKIKIILHKHNVMLCYVRTHASFMITLLSHCWGWGFLMGQSPPIGLFGSTSPREGLSCGTTATTSTSKTTIVPNICMNLEHKNIFTATWNNLFHGLCPSCLKTNKTVHFGDSTSPSPQDKSKFNSDSFGPYSKIYSQTLGDWPLKLAPCKCFQMWYTIVRNSRNIYW